MTYLSDQKTLYLLKPDLKVWATATQIRWSEEGEKTQSHPREGIRDLVVRDSVNLDGSVLKLASGGGLPIAYVDGRFSFIGHFVGPMGGKGGLRTAQYSLCQDDTRSLLAAKSAVAAKVFGQIGLMKEYKIELNTPLPDFGSAANRDSLLGMEGSMANWYFRRWPEVLAESGFEYSGRRRHPAPDPVNALYDLAISLLANEIYTFCSIVGLDPYVGFYHVTTANRPSLVADLIEEWRAPIVDKFVLRSFRRKELSTDDFVMKNGACRLAGSAWGKAVAKWTDWYLNTERARNAYRIMSYRDLVEGQVRHFVRFCRGDESEFRGHQSVR